MLPTENWFGNFVYQEYLTGEDRKYTGPLKYEIFTLIFHTSKDKLH